MTALAVMCAKLKTRESNDLSNQPTDDDALRRNVVTKSFIGDLKTSLITLQCLTVLIVKLKMSF